jgi:hypothetical protein
MADHGRWSWGGGFECMKSDGDTSFRESIGGNVSNDDYERVVGNGSLGLVRSARRDSFRVDARVGRDERGNPGRTDRIRSGSIRDSTRFPAASTSRVGVAASAVFGDAATFATARCHLVDIHPAIYAQSVRQIRRSKRVASAAATRRDFDRGIAGILAGVEVVGEQADNTFVTGSGVSADSRRSHDAGLFFREPVSTPDHERPSRRVSGSNTSGARRSKTTRAFSTRARISRRRGVVAQSQDLGRVVSARHEGLGRGPGWTKIRGGRRHRHQTADGVRDRDSPTIQA